jgi:hypothetical protein
MISNLEAGLPLAPLRLARARVLPRTRLLPVQLPSPHQALVAQARFSGAASSSP